MRFVACGLLLPLAVILPRCATAQRGGPTPPLIRGELIDRYSHQPVSSATVSLIGDSGQVVVVVTADSAGTFHVDLARDGIYRIRATHQQYSAAESAPLSVHAGSPQLVRLQLARLPVLLDRVSVRDAAPVAQVRPTEQLIRGRLVDESSGLPLSGGIIELRDEDAKALVATKTNDNGFFQLVTPSPGLYRLRGKHVGFQPAEQGGLSLRLGDTLVIEFRLSRVAQALDPVMVTATAKPWPPAKGERQVLRELYERMRRFGGLRHAQFVLRDTIDAYANRFYSISEMLSRVVVPPLPKASESFRCRGMKQYVDGLPFEADGVILATAFYDLTQIDLVEVYTHPSIPSEFGSPIVFPGTRSPGVPPCRVISLWTRYRKSPLTTGAPDTTLHQR